MIDSGGERCQSKKMQIRYNIKQKENSKVFFVADLHAKHAKSFILEPRGYKTADEAYADIFTQWNAVVGQYDTVFLLGDVVVGAGLDSVTVANELLYGLNGKIILLNGNHNAGVKQIYRKELKEQFNLDSDYREVFPLWTKDEKITFFGDYAEVVVDGQLCVLFHYPIESWNEMKASFHIHGHCHRNLPLNPNIRRIDVGWDYKKRPVSFDEIKLEMDKIEFKPVDHHGK
jgi:calcineurin-like phosphoesterase family protein